MNNIFRRIAPALVYALLLIASPARSASNEPDLIDWQSWSPEIFEQAARENKIVLLNLEAVWCHWCHVMDQKTYSDETVATVIRKHFIPVKVDHDARPDLAARYRDYGWPATIFLNGAGDDIVKRAGYIAPQLFAKLLLAIVDDHQLGRQPWIALLPMWMEMEKHRDSSLCLHLQKLNQMLYKNSLVGLNSPPLKNRFPTCVYSIPV